MSFARFICRDDEEREWLLDMHRRIAPYSRRASAVLGGLIVLCLPWFNPWSILPIVASTVVFGVGSQLVDRWQRLDPLVYAWLATQALMTAAIAINGRQHVGDLSLLMFAGIGAAGGFPTRLVVATTAYTAALMIGVSLGFDGAAVLDDPPLLIVPVGMLLSVQIIATAVRRASFEHRIAAVVDPLTGLLNRVALAARAAELEHLSQFGDHPVALIIVDIDHFKAVNDRHGHPAGDAVLCDFAYLIRKHLRPYDSAYRIGGEEFVLLAPGLDAGEATALAERLRRAVRAEPVDGLAITASFGVSATTADGRFVLAASIAEADARLYEAKAAGRDRVVGAERPEPVPA